jgi:hypothetical protein
MYRGLLFAGQYRGLFFWKSPGGLCNLIKNIPVFLET